MAVEAASDRIRVFVVAENRLLREALAGLLAKKNDIQVVASVALTSEVVSRIAELHPQVLLLDAAAFVFSGTCIVSQVLRDASSLKVVMIGMAADDVATFLRCVQAGVTGYLLTDASAGEIVAAVRSVVREGAVCPPCLCTALFDYVIRQSPAFEPGERLPLGLTRREQQLAQMIDSGLSNKEIAARLNISDQTVKNHVHHMLRKLGTSDRMAAVRVCRQQGLVS
ncbi:MAG TPA: response regulator transcription factor [Terriglobales bacterium]|nr:response regulator transcription factor [Terriglobales bacterium]